MRTGFVLGFTLAKTILTALIEDANRAIELDSLNAMAYSTLGAIAEKRGEFGGAWSNYDLAIKAAPWYKKSLTFPEETFVHPEAIWRALWGTLKKRSS